MKPFYFQSVYYLKSFQKLVNITLLLSLCFSELAYSLEIFDVEKKLNSSWRIKNYSGFRR